MVSRYELRIRELDDESLALAESAKRIARQVRGNEGSIRLMLYCKRKGFGSYVDYLNYLAVKKGFNSFAHYAKVKKVLLEKYRNLSEEGMVLVDDLVLDGFEAESSRREISKVEDEELVGRAINLLDERKRKVVVGRFFEGKTLEEVGKDVGVTRQRAYQLEEDALDHMRWHFRIINLL